MNQSYSNLGRSSFGSKFGIIAATAGSAVGLGNIWRFPYIAGENGGGAFIIIYVAFIMLIGIPAMMCELSIGRATQKNPFGAFKELRPNGKWYLVGCMGIAAVFFINSFYSVVAGWTLFYLFEALTNQFHAKDAGQIEAVFSSFQESGWIPILCSLLFVVITAVVVSSGVKKGIERWSKILMPILLLFIVIMAVRSMTLPNAGEGLAFLFKPDFSKITSKSILDALGQAFFSLSIGMGVLITYGSYINKGENLAQTAVSVSIADTLIAILSGVAIFPAVFSFGISPTSGPDLVFLALPNIFSQMTGGYFFSVVFFILLIIAALTSTISILEVLVVCVSEELGINRVKSTVISATVVGIFAVLCSLSITKIPELSMFGLSLFDLFDFVSSNIILTLDGTLMIIFVAWVAGKKWIQNELSSNGLYKVNYIKPFMLIIKFIVPAAIILVFLQSVGIFKF